MKRRLLHVALVAALAVAALAVTLPAAASAAPMKSCGRIPADASPFVDDEVAVTASGTDCLEARAVGRQAGFHPQASRLWLLPGWRRTDFMMRTYHQPSCYKTDEWACDTIDTGWVYRATWRHNRAVVRLRSVSG
jgi:hypothetical protein